MKTLITILSILFCSVIASGQGKPEGLFINSKAPDFKAKDQTGIEISLKELRKKGPVVLLFYRGNWCPYCNRQLTRLQDSLRLILDKGASVVAVTPEQPEGITKTVEKTKAAFSIITDENMKIANAYKVAYEVDERTATRLKGSGVDLLATNGQKQKAYLPVPAVYIINSDGAVTYRFFDDNYKARPSIRELLSEIK